MTRKQTPPRLDSRHQKSAVKHHHVHSGKHAPPPVVDGRWLIKALVWSLLGAAFCAWAVLCLLFWQGSWQLLYHPKTTIARTPASIGLAFEPVGFAATESGVQRLQGWWIPAPPAAQFARYTVLYLHGQDENLGDTIDALAHLQAVGVNVLAFDYRGYGQSQFARPSEANWLEDAAWALQYLRDTRHIDSRAIILDGSGLGANLALEFAGKHPELVGVVVESPVIGPMNALFSDPRASMVPARLLMRDCFDLVAAARALRTPSLWLIPVRNSSGGSMSTPPQAFDQVTGLKKLVWLHTEANSLTSPDATHAQALSQWLRGLPGSSQPALAH